MIHDTAQGQTQYDLCEELRAQVAALTEERDKFFADKSENTGLPSHVYQQVADLEAQVAALRKERDKYKEFFARDYEAELAASQAREAVLRAAMLSIADYCRIWGGEAERARKLLEDYLARPTDDTALRERLNAAQVAVLRQAATMCRDNHGTASLTAKQLDNMTDELESTAPTPHNQHEVDDKHRTPR